METIRLLRRIMGRLSPRPWYKDLCEYYHVTPDQALTLGTRSENRRPDLPSSSTTHAVSGKSFEELWSTRARTDPAAIHAFYYDVGAWFSFRQVVYHRKTSFRFILKDLKPGDRLCEYGAGVGPVSFWLAMHLPEEMSIHFTLCDVPCEHLTFGGWRLEKLIAERQLRHSLDTREVMPGRLPLEGQYDIATILEVYEHLHNPLEVTEHLCEHLRPRGLFWENYILHQDPHAADLEVAQKERDQVFSYLDAHFDLLKGEDPHSQGGGGNRCWRKK